jgi:predicted transcriptional regulator
VEVVESAVLMSLLTDKRRWPVNELAEWVNEERFEEAVTSLKEAGLLQREDDVIFATPAAIRGDELTL